jgi:hypothetical protein
VFWKKIIPHLEHGTNRSFDNYLPDYTVS